MAGGPLAAKLRHLCGPAGYTEPLFLDRQAVAGSGAQIAGPAEYGCLDVDSFSRRTAGGCGRSITLSQRLRSLPPKWRGFLEQGLARCPGMAPGELHPD